MKKECRKVNPATVSVVAEFGNLGGSVYDKGGYFSYHLNLTSPIQHFIFTKSHIPS